MFKDRKINTFWKWFSRENYKYLFLNEMTDEEKEPLLDEFLFHLHKYHKELFFEIGGRSDDEKLEVVITACGDKRYFDKVTQLVEKAPHFEDWEIIAFKQAQGIEFTTRHEGLTFDPQKTLFIPLESRQKPDAVGICVCYPEFSEEKEDIFTNGTYLMLDTILGEKSAVEDLDHVEIMQTPKNIGDYPFRMLSGIEAYIKERKSFSL